MWRKFDYISFIVSLSLLSIGLFTIYSISLSDKSVVQENVFTKQLIFTTLGIVAYFLVSFIDYKNLKNLSTPIYISTLLLLAFTYVWGLETRGSTRWIDLGIFRVQPSEFMKLGLIILLASVFSSKSAMHIKNLLIPAAATIIPLILIYKQPDLGSTIVLGVICLAIIFTSGVRLRYVVVVAVLTTLLVPLVYNSFQEYQKQRITTFLNPSSDPLGSGYNVIQSMIAVGSGQITGKGYGRGTQSHLNFLPEHHTDFIFATIAEELGLVGSTLILVLIGILCLRLLTLASKTEDTFASLLIIGVVTQLLSQFAINIGMNVGILPVTGITLPLVSYGGSSLLSIMISLGLVQSINRNSLLA